MGNSKFRRQLLLGTMFMGTAVAGSALAQTAATPAAQGGTTEVVVTGSRIPQPNLTSTSPLTTVNSQELKLEGTTNVESLLNNLPQVVASQTNQVSNGSNGTATVNLRNLGSQRTLVLVDGKRLQPGDPSNKGSADLNTIPTALVDRVDVVTGGASSIYGSDAVAGVVNFIMKRNFNGVRIDAQGSFFNHQNSNQMADHMLATSPYPVVKPGDVTADGFTYDVTAIVGSNFADDKGNVTAYAGYRNIQPVLQGSRDYAYCGAAVSGAHLSQEVCSGSSNAAIGRFDNTGALNAITGRGTTVQALNPDGTKTLVPYVAGYAYNFNPINFIQREDDTYRAGYFAHYDVSKEIQFYSDFMFTDDHTNAQIAPSGFFRNSGPNLATGFSINCNNPLISAAEVAQFCPGVAVTPGAPGGSSFTTSIGYRFATVPRNTDFRHTDYLIDVGLRGDLRDGWHYDAYMQYGTTILSNLTTGYASLSRLQQALNVVNVNGVPTCTTGVSVGCVPLDIFASYGRNFSPAALKYVLVPGFTTGQAVQQVGSASITGDLGQYGVKSPFADEGVGIALGSEYRREQISTNFDFEQQTGDLSGSGGQSLPVSGSYDVYELFGEARVPVVENRPFFKDLSVDLAYRFSDYSLAGTTNTYSGEANWSPNSDVRFRFSYNRAVRAPSAVELFTPQVAGLSGYQDPCSGAKPAFTQAQCAATGLNPALYGLVQPCASSQCEVLTGGNTHLAPETADTFSLGFVFTPTFIRGLSITADYFNILIDNVIDTGASPTSILNFCANGQTNYCSLIHRDIQGTLNSSGGYIFETNTNSGSLQTRGVDFTVNYRTRPVDWHLPVVSAVPGSLAFNVVGTWTQDVTDQPVPGRGHYDCAGLYGTTCGVPQPHWRTESRLSWITPYNLTFSLNWRYIGATKLDLNQSNTFLRGGVGFYDIADAHIHDYSYWDLAVTYRFRDRYTFRAGINNLFDRDPPIIDANTYGIVSPPFGNGNTYPGVYDALGRQVFVGVTADF